MSMRVVTLATSTALARTYPVEPFGRMGSCTRYQAALQSASSTAPRIPNTVR